LACTSHFEGFSLVVLEAMRIGVPCVAFDCPYGPRTIIQNNKNGFYVPDDNYRVLADRINFLIKNTGRRREFSESAVLRAEQFNIDVVMEKWKELFESIVKE
jgi:glycosyltransferase involved in cell wall biosynthesis